jgi:hypothetical protein
MKKFMFEVMKPSLGLEVLLEPGGPFYNYKGPKNAALISFLLQFRLTKS